MRSGFCCSIVMTEGGRSCPEPALVDARVRGLRRSARPLPRIGSGHVQGSPSGAILAREVSVAVVAASSASSSEEQSRSVRFLPAREPDCKSTQVRHARGEDRPPPGRIGIPRLETRPAVGKDRGRSLRLEPRFAIRALKLPKRTTRSCVLAVASAGVAIVRGDAVLL